MLAKVEISVSAFHTCVSHALSTERQEIMGLLLGSWTSEETGVRLRGDIFELDEGNDHNVMAVILNIEGVSAAIKHVMVMTRTDRRKDRVEVGYEQLAEAVEVASRMPETRVIGWYHSHPHITVLPSHVDVRTQAQYQQMDPRFVGLIFAVFQDDSKSRGPALSRVRLMAFQSIEDVGGSTDPILVPDEDSFGHVEVPHTSPAGGGMVARGIPVQVMKGRGSLAEAVGCVVGLQETLLREERLAYESAVKMRAGLRLHGHVHALFTSAVYAKGLAALLDESALPLVQTLETALVTVRKRARDLTRANQLLEATLDTRVRDGLAKRMAAVDGHDSPMEVDLTADTTEHTRHSILQRAGRGVEMGIEEDHGVRCRVAVAREHGRGNRFGCWMVKVDDAVKGALKVIRRERRGSCAFVVGQLSSEPGNQDETLYFRCLDDVTETFWIGRMQPIVCPDHVTIS